MKIDWTPDAIKAAVDKLAVVADPLQVWHDVRAALDAAVAAQFDEHTLKPVEVFPGYAEYLAQRNAQIRADALEEAAIVLEELLPSESDRFIIDAIRALAEKGLSDE